MKSRNIKQLLGPEAADAHQAEQEAAEIVRNIESLQQQIKLLEQKLSKPLQKPLREETSIKQQLLILYYLGYIEALPSITKEKKYELIAVLLNRGKQGIKDEFDHLDEPPHLYNIKTEKNLEFVINYFNQFGFQNALEKAQAELSEIKSRKL